MNYFTRTAMLASVAGSLILGGPAQARIVDNNLTGNTDFDGWDSVGGLGFPYNVPAGAWEFAPGVSAPLGSMEAGSGDATLLKQPLNKDGFASGHASLTSSLYSFSTDSSFTVADSTALAGLATIVFTIEGWLNEVVPPLGTAVDGVPVLNYNGGSQALAPVNTFFGNGVNDLLFAGDAVDTLTFTYQWDTTGLGITDFSIDWDHRVHAGIVGLQLDQSDVFTTASATVVPVPAAVWAFASGLLGLAGIARRRAR